MNSSFTITSNSMKRFTFEQTGDGYGPGCEQSDWINRCPEQAECFTRAGIGARSDKVFLVTLTEAYEISRSPSLVTELQARLLAREDAGAIAARMNLSAVAVIELFHDVFFGEQPHLDCTSIILNSAFSAGFGRQHHIPDFADLIKLSAYRGGSEVPEDLRWYQQTPRPLFPKKLRSLSDEDLQNASRWCALHCFVMTYKVAPKTELERLQYMAFVGVCDLDGRRRSQCLWKSERQVPISTTR